MSFQQEQQHSTMIHNTHSRNPGYTDPEIYYTPNDNVVINNNTNSSQASPVSPTEEENPHTSRQLKGAAAVGGIAGLVLGGPLLAVAAAGGAAYVVTSKGSAGSVVRKGGDAVADAGVSLKRYNRKHQVVQRTANQVTQGCSWAAKRLQPKATRSAAATPASTPTNQ
jgi:ABC-type nitrate/sulfonate/bicarbonate transport system substrate-binding protein